ncbi:MAG: extracellular solute-binding protein [Spirochaetaceae bacterium]|jgi:spermidine/putrescine transport system substrate-binding protein|nr:extracellular solute-binding protein [Spirochaetaceae bacterium]
MYKIPVAAAVPATQTHAELPVSLAFKGVSPGRSPFPNAARALLALFLLAGAGASLYAIGGKENSQNAAPKSSNKLFIYNWTYYTPKSVIEKFEKEYHVTVTYDEFPSNEDMYAKIKAGGTGYDIVFPSGDYVSIMAGQGMLERIDKTRLSNLKHIDPMVLQRATYDPTMEYAVPYYWGAAGVTVNTAKVPYFERKWSIFSRTDLKGKMTMLDDMREVIGDALVSLGYSVNSTNPAEIAAARDLITTQWKPNLVKFDAEAFGKGYANGDFWVVQGYVEGVFAEIADNAQLKADTVFFIPTEGGPAYIDSMCILKGAKNTDLAYKFIDFIHRPEIYAEFADTFRFPATVNVPARGLQKVTPHYKTEDLFNTELKSDVGEDVSLYQDVWFNAIRTGN